VTPRRRFRFEVEWYEQRRDMEPVVHGTNDVAEAFQWAREMDGTVWDRDRADRHHRNGRDFSADTACAVDSGDVPGRWFCDCLACGEWQSNRDPDTQPAPPQEWLLDD